MLDRVRSEQLEKERLSPLASFSSNSRGRKYPEEECRLRTAFQRDRDRIIHSKAFRRLKHKTQVFISPDGDHYRTRLTHTLEVAQISRTVGRVLKLNEDLIEAIALGHDLGHTPFGHAGEQELDLLLPGGFRHNEQSLRIVDELEENQGLNLTWEVRDGIVNHTGLQFPHTLEGQVVRFVDRIAYINHDLDDALRAGIIKMNDLPKQCIDILGEQHRNRINTMVVDLVEHSWGKNRIVQGRKVGQATESLREFLFAQVYVGSPAKKNEEKVRRLLRHLYSFYIDHPQNLSFFAQGRLNEDGLQRVVCDYIAGMTDRYAIYQYLSCCKNIPAYPTDQEILSQLNIP